jgi:hypothetical protein
MKITHTILVAFVTSLALCTFSSFAHADPLGAESGSVQGSATQPTPPKGVAPLVALAKALPRKPGSVRDYVWSLELHIPKVRWEIVEKDFFKAVVRTVEADVEMITVSLEMGYSKMTQLAERGQNRILDMNGKRLTEEEALERLAKHSPVLVSVTGELPDPYYLQCSKPDTLIVVFGLPKAKDTGLPTAPKKTAPKDAAETR